MCNKQNKKSKIVNNLLEGLLEIAIAIVCFGIGLLALWLLGIDFYTLFAEGELVILVGCIIFIAILLLVYFTAQKIKNRIRHDKNDAER